MLLLLLALQLAPGQTLICIDHGKVVEVSAGKKKPSPLRKQPKGFALTVARTGSKLAVATDDKELFVGDASGWVSLGPVFKDGGTSVDRPFVDAAGAHLFLQGGEDNSTAGAILVSAAGKRSYESDPEIPPTRIAPMALGSLEADQKEALRGRLSKQMPKDMEPTEALVWSEPSPWGGTLAAIATGEVEGDTPEARLWFVPQKGEPVELKYQGKLVGYRGLIGYDGELLLVDGKSTAAGKGTVVLRKDGSAEAVPGVDGPCSPR
jgi:hypothetical protein